MDEERPVGDMSFERLAARYAMELCEPLVSTRRRAETERGLTGSPPGLVTLWGTGLVAGVMSSLPPDDPWRLLGCDPSPQVVEHSGRARTLPVVRRRDGARFGSTDDHLDLVIPTGDEADDIEMAGGHTALGPAATAVLFWASQSWEVAARAVPAWLGLAALDEAVRAALFRRRSYRGPDDPWIIVHSGRGVPIVNELWDTVRTDDGWFDAEAWSGPWPRWDWDADIVHPTAWQEYHLDR